MAKDYWDKFQDEYQSVLKMAELALPRDEYSKIRDIYRIADPWKTVCSRTHKVISTQAAKLARTIMRNGCDIQETELALTNLWICLDSERYRLDWKRFQVENGVDKLFDKYKGA